jgi:hypothetical protein
LNLTFNCEDVVHRIFALPARYGGMSIYNSSETSDMEYEFSCQATERLTQAIVNQNDGYEEDLEALNKIKSGISKKRNEWFTAQRNVIVNEMEESQRLQLDLAAEKGASSWLTALPVKEFGYLMNKQEFNDLPWLFDTI